MRVRGLFTRNHHSIRSRLLTITFSVILFSGALVFANALTALKLASDQAIVSNANASKILLNQVEKSFAIVKQSLYNIVSGSDFWQVAEDHASNASKLAQYKLKTLLTEESYAYSYVDIFFVYMPEQSLLIESSSGFENANEKNLLKRELTRYLDAEKQANVLAQWTPIRLGNRFYLMFLSTSAHMYYGSLVGAEKLITAIYDKKLVGSDHTLFVTGDGVPMTTSEALTDYDFSAIPNIQDGHVDREYIIAGARFPSGSFSLVTMTKPGRVLAPLMSMLVLGAASLACLALMIPMVVSRINRWILRPVAELMDAMDDLKKGNVGLPLGSDRDCAELKLMKETFVDMRSQIHKLKMDVYEEQLLKQKTQLNYYRLQIRPHFFLNCMNMIYNFSQVGKKELVQRLVQSLCAYFRYSVRNTGDLLPLGAELEHARNYMDIQQMRFGDQLQARYEIAPPLLDALIPPLAVTTFVENSIKYARVADATTEICIEADESPEGFLRIRVADNGPGFSEEKMEEILSGRLSDKDEQKGEHLGIYNIQQRLWLLYGEDATLAMCNRKPTGTLAEIILPLKKGERNDDAIADR